MNLIFDRTQNDVDKVYATWKKFEVVETIGTYLPIKDLGEGKFLVFKGTIPELQEYFIGLKGAWNYSDLNRIGNAVRELKSAFESIGVHIDVVGKNNWVLGDVPEPSDAEDLLNDVATVKEAGNVPGDPVTTLDKLTYVTANRIEEIIYLAYLYTQRVSSQYKHCGVAISGSEGVIA